MYLHTILSHPIKVIFPETFMQATLLTPCWKMSMWALLFSQWCWWKIPVFLNIILWYISRILKEPAAPTFQAPADPEDRSSRAPLIHQNPFTHQYDITFQGGNFNTRHWLSNISLSLSLSLCFLCVCVCVCVCVWIGPIPIFCHVHLVLKLWPSWLDGN